MGRQDGKTPVKLTAQKMNERPVAMWTLKDKELYMSNLLKWTLHQTSVPKLKQLCLINPWMPRCAKQLPREVTNTGGGRLRSRPGLAVSTEPLLVVFYLVLEQLDGWHLLGKDPADTIHVVVKTLPSKKKDNQVAFKQGLFWWRHCGSIVTILTAKHGKKHKMLCQFTFKTGKQNCLWVVVLSVF